MSFTINGVNNDYMKIGKRQLKKTLIGRKIIFPITLLILVMGAMFFLRSVDNSAFANEISHPSGVVEIATAEDLFKLTDKHYSLKIFRLINNIDLASDESWHGQVIDWQTHGWRPLDTYDMMDCVFDGGGYTIWNLSVKRIDEYSGLFSRNSLNIKNLLLDFVDISGGIKSGTLAGINYGTIENVHAIGNVQASVRAGGITAENFGNVDNCSFNGNVTGRTAGGLFAENSCATLANSYAQGIVKGHLVGGLIGVSGALGTGEITTSFSSSVIIAESYDTMPLRAAGFVAVRYETVTIDNCYSLHGTTPVAMGDSDGITTLSSLQFLKAENLIGFDFENYWGYLVGSLVQRTIGVSSNEQTMLGIAFKIKGDKKYYLQWEKAVLHLDTGDKRNIGIKSVVVDGVERNSDFSDNKYELKSVMKQINIELELQYLIKVEINSLVYGEILRPQKSHFAPNESVILFAKRMDGFKEPILSATLFGQNVLFNNVTMDDDAASGYYRFSADLGEQDYSATSLLFVDIHYDPIVARFEMPVYWIVIICVAGAGIIITAILVIIKFIKSKIHNNTRSKIKWYYDSYKILQLILVGHLILISCFLVSYVRVFEKWDKGEIISVEDIRASTSQNITYLVGDEEYTAKITKRSGFFSSLKPVELVDYQVSNPHNVMYDRALSLAILLILGGIILTVLITLCIIEFKKRQRNDKEKSQLDEAIKSDD